MVKATNELTRAIHYYPGSPRGHVLVGEAGFCVLLPLLGQQIYLSSPLQFLCLSFLSLILSPSSLCSTGLSYDALRLAYHRLDTIGRWFKCGLSLLFCDPLSRSVTFIRGVIGALFGCSWLADLQRLARKVMGKKDPLFLAILSQRQE